VRARADEALYDAMQDICTDGAALRLPFDPRIVIDALREERYAAAFHARNASAFGLVRWAYYAARDLLPVALRRLLQRVYLRGGSAQPFPRWPLDTTVEALLDSLLALTLRHRNLDRIPFIWFWPQRARACLMMTHDVETWRGLDVCDELMDLDANFGLRSSFQVVPESRYTIPDALIREMRARGFEVNLHDLRHDGRLFANRDEFLRRAARINAHARAFGTRGFRSGSLYRNPDWLGALDVAFDMSTPNVGHLDPQPGGCCTVRPYFIRDIVELPLTTMQDHTLFHIVDDYSLALWGRQVEGILARNGLVSFNIHPDYIAERRARGVYVDLLRWLSALRVREPLWVALPGEVERWWRARSRMRVVLRAGSWAIEGAEADQACLAWARMEQGRIVYDLA
jgi:hypothetical protein